MASANAMCSTLVGHDSYRATRWPRRQLISLPNQSRPGGRGCHGLRVRAGVSCQTSRGRGGRGLGLGLVAEPVAAGGCWEGAESGRGGTPARPGRETDGVGRCGGKKRKGLAA
eukprot:scaffold11550_cov108-Isochrysis_galbana.AAC.1